MESVEIPIRADVVTPVADLQEAWRRLGDRYWLFVGISAVGILVGSLVPMAILLGPMMCGVYSCFRDHRQGRPVRFEGLFVGFQQPMLLQSILATLMMVGLGLVVLIPFVLAVVGVVVLLAAVKAPEGLAVMLAALGYLSWLFAATLLGMAVAFAFPLIVDRKLEAWPAVRLSLRGVRANLGGMLGLTTLTFVLGLGGVLCCYVGAFLVLPVTFGAQMVAYEKIFGLADVAD